MNELKIFENEQFGKVRIVISESKEPLFCLADVCKALDLSNPSMVAQSLKKDGLSSNEVIDSLGRKQTAIFISEANLYKAIFQSRKEDAGFFQDWVCEEVIPSIRRHGAYMTEQTIEKALTNPDFLIQLATNLKEEQAKRIEAESQIKENEPKVLFANAVIGSKSSCLIGELAKIITQNGYEIGQNRLFQWMRDNKYLGTRGENYNIPLQQFVEQGLFELKKGVRSGNDGVLHTTITVKCSGKGQSYFINKFLGNNK